MSIKARITRLENQVEDMAQRLGQLERGYKGPLIVPVAVLEDPDALAVSMSEYSELFYGPIIILPAVGEYDG